MQAPTDAPTHHLDEIIKALQAAIVRRSRLRPGSRDQWRATREVRVLQDRLVAVVGEGRPVDGQPSVDIGGRFELPTVRVDRQDDVADLVQGELVPGLPTFVAGMLDVSDV